MCGVVGIALKRNHHNLGRYLYASLYNLQHRGKEEAGIAVWNDKNTKFHAGEGEIGQVFFNFDLGSLFGSAGVAHNRYSTSGGEGAHSRTKNHGDFQPMSGIFKRKTFFVSYNGNLVNTEALKMEFSRRIKRDFHTMPSRQDIDTSLMVGLIETSRAETFKGALLEVLPLFFGAFSLVILYDGSLYIARDHLGFRPIFICRFRDGIAIASETCAFSSLPEAGRPYYITKGEIAVISEQSSYGYESELWRRNSSPGRFCMFEYIYFSRPDGYLGKERVMFIQERLGRQLAKEAPLSADVVTGVPDSGINAAIGYAKELFLPYDSRLIFRPHTVGRTFIDPVQGLRVEGVKFKHFTIDENIGGKKVVVVDDSIVRGNTSRHIVDILRNAGAKEVHMRISSPPYRHPCYFGIDTWRVKDELIAGKLKGDVEEVRKKIGSDSLAYLSLEGAKSAWKGNEGLCDACFSGEYPVKINQ